MDPGLPGSVLFVVHVGQHSGPQRSLLPRLESLAARGARVTTLVPGPGPAADAARQLGDVITGGPGALTMPGGPGDLTSLARHWQMQVRTVQDAARSSGADLVIVSSALLPGALIGARRAGAATMLYSGEVLGGGGPRGSLRRQVARFAGQRADAVIASSEAAAEPYRRYDISLTVIYPPITVPPGPPADLDARAGELRSTLGIEGNEPVVSSLGAISEGRGQDLLLEAADLAGRRGSNWRLVIGGEPFDREADRGFDKRLREELSDLGLEDRALMPDRIDDREALFAISTVFVNPVRVPESFGRASCEAIVAGCPVVSARIGGTPEALIHGETALLVPPDNAAELSAAIDRLVYDPQLATRLVRDGKRDVASRLSPGAGESTFMLAVDEAFSNKESGRDEALAQHDSERRAP